MKPRTFHFTRYFSPDLGIDLGTAQTRLCAASEGISLDEPSVVAVEQDSRRVLNHGQAVGNLAKIMLGRTPDSMHILRPVRNGVIADFESCEAMLRAFFRKVLPRAWGFKPRVLVAVPTDITPVERHAVLTTVMRAGARQVFLIGKAKTAGLGAGLPIAQPVASLICDIGAGSTEVSVICLGDVAVSELIRVAGDEMDRVIASHLRRKHKLSISDQTAERIKIEIGAASPLQSGLTLEVGGRDLVSGLPRRTELTSEEAREALIRPVQAIVDGIGQTLERCHADHSADLMENGMVLVGGGAQLRGLDHCIAEATGMPVRVAEEPATCVARGLTICLENLDVWHTLIERREAA